MKKFLLILVLVLGMGVGNSICPVWGAGTGNGIKVCTLAKTSFSWDGSKLPNYPTGQPQITILKISIQPGVKLCWHKHPVINAGVLLKGSLTVITEDHHVLHLKAGDPIVEVVNKWHYGLNEGTTPAEIIVFYAGVKNMPITIKK
ncbi:Cupin domain-containing protein [Desulfonauticus submarinus]|uniref:Cupin domain-containing protein n=1 Tax=Desulfonauticus submarinus TaxID=206665 RepID=A0A1H0EUT6_9BACT|nr:cupin domain-containing protein [Desulfonauticus submarinus]SDN86140.1 Cupin domain-containing protein [Desulfonauticus submarinus]